MTRRQQLRHAPKRKVGALPGAMIAGSTETAMPAFTCIEWSTCGCPSAQLHSQNRSVRHPGCSSLRRAVWPVQLHRPACGISEPPSAPIPLTVCRSSLECPAWPDAAIGRQHSAGSSSCTSSLCSGTSPSSGSCPTLMLQRAAPYQTQPARRSSIDLAVAAPNRPLQRSSVDLTPRPVRAWRRPSCEVGPRERVLRHNFKVASRSNSSGEGEGQQAAMDAAVRSHDASVLQRGQAWVQLQAATLRALQHAVSWNAGGVAAWLHACYSLLQHQAGSSSVCRTATVQIAETAVAGAQTQFVSAIMCEVASSLQACGTPLVSSQ